MTEGESEPGPAGATEVGSFAGRGRRA
jgi:hypothetical protein